MVKGKYVTLTMKNDETYKKFEEICKQYGLKKATTITKLIEKFNENPQAFLFNNKEDKMYTAMILTKNENKNIDEVLRKPESIKIAKSEKEKIIKDYLKTWHNESNFNEFVNFLKNNTNNTLIIKTPAGWGKTFLAQVLAELGVTEAVNVNDEAVKVKNDTNAKILKIDSDYTLANSETFNKNINTYKKVIKEFIYNKLK